jgi:uncharacterized protein (TIGR02118 family)
MKSMNQSVKLISLLRADRTAHAWKDFARARIAAGQPGLKRLVFNEVRPINVRTGEKGPPAFPAVIETWFSSREDAEAFAGRLRAEAPAVQLFVDALLVNDRGKRPLPDKIMVAFKRLPHLSREQAQEHWRTRHVEIGFVEHNAGDFLQLYFQNHVLATDQPPGSACDYDGMPEFWVDPADLAMIGQDAPVMRAIAEDEALFAYSAGIVTMSVSEEELFVAAGIAPGWPVS